MELIFIKRLFHILTLVLSISLLIDGSVVSRSKRAPPEELEESAVPDYAPPDQPAAKALGDDNDKFEEETPSEEYVRRNPNSDVVELPDNRPSEVRQRELEQARKAQMEQMQRAQQQQQQPMQSYYPYPYNNSMMGMNQMYGMGMNQMHGQMPQMPGQGQYQNPYQQYQMPMMYGMMPQMMMAGMMPNFGFPFMMPTPKPYMPTTTRSTTTTTTAPPDFDDVVEKFRKGEMTDEEFARAVQAIDEAKAHKEKEMLMKEQEQGRSLSEQGIGIRVVEGTSTVKMSKELLEEAKAASKEEVTELGPPQEKVIAILPASEKITSDSSGVPSSSGVASSATSGASSALASAGSAVASASESPVSSAPPTGSVGSAPQAGSTQTGSSQDGSASGQPPPNGQPPSPSDLSKMLMPFLLPKMHPGVKMYQFPLQPLLQQRKLPQQPQFFQPQQQFSPQQQLFLPQQQQFSPQQQQQPNMTDDSKLNIPDVQPSILTGQSTCESKDQPASSGHFRIRRPLKLKEDPNAESRSIEDYPEIPEIDLRKVGKDGRRVDYTMATLVPRKPAFILRARLSNLPSKEQGSPDAWWKRSQPKFCWDEIYEITECKKKRRERRWSFNHEDERCYLYEDECASERNNTFKSLPDCMTTCWRPK